MYTWTRVAYQVCVEKTKSYLSDYSKDNVKFMTIESMMENKYSVEV